MFYFRLIWRFIQASIQQETAYRANFFIGMYHSLLNLGLGVLALTILFSQVETLQGWSYPETLALLGVYLLVGALRGLFIGPSLEALAGLGQEIWSGNFDFILLRPINTQFLVTFRHWRPFALFDLVMGAGVIFSAFLQTRQEIHSLNLLAFAVALTASIAVLYAVLLAFTALVFWSPGFLFTWVFDALFQLARYPVQIYPHWLRFLLTWVIPVGIMTTIPAQALTSQVSVEIIISSVLIAVILLAGSSFLFNYALRRYSSASS